MESNVCSIIHSTNIQINPDLITFCELLPFYPIVGKHKKYIQK